LARQNKLFEVLKIVDRQADHQKLQHTQDGLVATDHLLEKAQSMLNHMEQDVFAHCAVSGPSGSGKMSLVRLTH
jgi:replication-associated recombination protein RarA